MRNRLLRRVELGFVGFNAAEYAEWIAILVYAYAHGGTITAAAVAVVSLVPCALLAPLIAARAERYAPGRVLAAGYGAQAIGMGLAAAVIAGGAPPAVVYGAAVLAAVPFTVVRPAQSVLLPGVVARPEELVAANVISSWSEGVGVVAGPLLAGAVIAPIGPAGVLAVFAAVSLGGAAAVWPARDAVAAVPAEDGPSAGVRDAVGALREDPNARILFGLVATQSVVLGALDLLFVVIAFRLIDGGRSAVGFLGAAFGFGGIAGSALAVALVCRRRLAPPLLAAAVVWAAAFVALGAQRGALGAYLLLGLSGAARSIVDVAGRSLLQRVCGSAVLARVFGLLEGSDMAAYALGSLLVPALAAIDGPRAAVIGVGLVLPVVLVLGLRRLLSIDAHATVPVVQIGLLRGSELFSALPAPALEALAHDMVPAHARGGEVILAEGDHGDRYFMIADGEVAVSRAGTQLRKLSRGEGFGEIALLHDVPRTATVTATAETALYMLEKPSFLAALTGHAPSAGRAELIAGERLART
ncbi:MAG TPA: cyclic nucleotide-binding domain-containing protein [Solirubrobacteraceae bacterium]|jgi:hypothetical protein|nr:cyclic nucleotide-binding domain-containing protein [Solirubrobacteraceae bacterium]